MLNVNGTLTRAAHAFVALLLCACAVCAQTAASAQASAAQWVSVTPDGEEFQVKMPKTPTTSDVRASTGGMFASGRRYEFAGDDSNTYAVWSLTFKNDRGESIVSQKYMSEGIPPGQSFLDFVADFAWDMIVKPELDEAVRLKEKPAPGASFIRHFDLNERPAREYRMWLRERGGPVYVYSDGRRAYVVAAFGTDPQSPLLKQFVESFAVGTKTDKPPSLPAPVTLKVDPILLGGGGIGPGRGEGNPTVKGGTGTGVGAGEPVDYSKTFKTGEVTHKAVITSKPEPGFTESARKFNVTGVVRIRGVLAANGKVERLTIIKWLPHGLTQKALDAAKQIRFEPAQKDGHQVSQYVTLEYNFNIY